jgi:hypothetical protein
MAKELKGVNIGAMFNIDLAPGAEGAPTADDTKDLCEKCKGKGTFLSYKGKVVGPCFKCAGTGLANPNMGKVVKPGDCPKCFGSGEWRPNHPCFACNGTGKAAKAVEADVDVSAITACFATAYGNGIKTPKLRLGDFIFSRAPDHGTNAGAVYVKRKADNEYLGKVAAGKFLGAKVCDDPTKATIVAVASDPLMSAKAYGQKFGSCSVCGRTLTQTKWIEAGIGPVCAEKFGW